MTCDICLRIATIAKISAADFAEKETQKFLSDVRKASTLDLHRITADEGLNRNCVTFNDSLMSIRVILTHG